MAWTRSCTSWSLEELFEDPLDEPDIQEDARASLEKMRRLILRMREMMKRLDPLAVPRTLRQPIQTSISRCIDEVLEAYSDRLVESGPPTFCVVGQLR